MLILYGNMIELIGNIMKAAFSVALLQGKCYYALGKKMLIKDEKPKTSGQVKTQGTVQKRQE